MDSIKTIKPTRSIESSQPTWRAILYQGMHMSLRGAGWARGRRRRRREGDIWLTPHSKYGMGSFAAAAAPPFAPDDDDDVVNKYTAIANDVDSTRTEPKLQVAEKSHESG